MGRAPNKEKGRRNEQGPRPPQRWHIPWEPDTPPPTRLPNGRRRPLNVPKTPLLPPQVNRKR